MRCEILRYGDPRLRRKAKPVSRVDGDIRRLIRDLLESMYAAKGLGLAASQIGRPEAVCVVDISPSMEAGRPDSAPPSPDATMPLVLINPRIEVCDGVQEGQEGCLSFPDLFVPLRRAAKVTVFFEDPDHGGRRLEAAGLLARAIQHEIDHLNGVLLVDRMSPLQKAAARGKLNRIKRETLEKAAETS